MSDREMYVLVWKMVLTSIVGTTALILGYCVFSTIHCNQSAILKAQIESTPSAREAAHARYLEAKALSDKAMFEEMAKHPSK